MNPCLKRPSIWLLFWVLTALAACQTDRDHDLVYQYRDQLPKGFPVPEIPADNEPTPARITLGRALFYDVSLSADSTKSCASCHQQAYAFADNVALSEGIKGRKAKRNSPSLANVAYQKKLLREGGLATLEMQVLVPVQEHNEFDFNLLSVAKRLQSNAYYVKLAKEGYNRNLDEYVITRAIASFERTLLAGNSPYFQYLNQDKKQALSAEAVRGMNLFFGEKAACGQCHSGWLLTNQGYANNGLYLQYSDPGKMRLTGLAQDEALFKIPSLHNVALTAPYMFDGSLPDLASVIEHYASGGQPHVNRHPAIKPFVLTAGEKADLIAFLHSLTDADFIHQPALAKP